LNDLGGHQRLVTELSCKDDFQNYLCQEKGMQLSSNPNFFLKGKRASFGKNTVKNCEMKKNLWCRTKIISGEKK
jgi:hypothetical protein